MTEYNVRPDELHLPLWVQRRLEAQRQRIADLESDMAQPLDDAVESVSVIMGRLMKERDDAQIRLYGALWKLVVDEVISESKAMELAGASAQEFDRMRQCPHVRTTPEGTSYCTLAEAGERLG